MLIIGRYGRGGISLALAREKLLDARRAVREGTCSPAPTPMVRPNAVTEEALLRIGALYKIEEQIRGKPSDERRSARQARAAPLLDDMKRWFEATLTTPCAKSDATKAI